LISNIDGLTKCQLQERPRNPSLEFDLPFSTYRKKEGSEKIY